MGQPKERLTVGPKTLLRQTLDTMRQVVEPVVASARRGQSIPSLPASVSVVCDHIDDQGPLEGIAMGLAALDGRCEAAFVCACDQPLLSAEVITRLIDRLGDAPAVVPEINGRLHPLTAVYRISCLATAQRLLDSGRRRATEFARQCGPRLLSAAELTDIDPKLASFRNINDLDEYERLVADLGQP